MGTIVTLNGVSHTIPANGESGWGTAVTNYLVALASGVLQKAGGAFTLTADADFGATYGLKSIYLKSRATNVAAAGVLRLGNAETLSWRNAANSADLALTANASNLLTYAGNPVVTLALGAASTALRMNAGGTAYEWAALTNVNIDAAAAIAYSKLNLATSIVNADVSASAAIVDTKLATIATALKVSNSATTAASANTASAIVARDGSGNFTAGTITAALTGNASGTAANVTGIVAPANGGTGIANNAASTLAISGSFATTLTVSGATGVTLPTTGTLATRAGVEVLTNKDIDGGTASNTLRITVPKGAKATLDALTRKEATLVYATDIATFYADNGTALVAVGAGSSGELNMVTNPSDATNWSKTGTTGAGANAPATTTTAGDLPLGVTVATALKLTSGTSSGAEASNYTSCSFTTPASLATKLKVEFYIRPGANFIASEWTVSIYAGAVRQSLSTDDATPATFLPNASGKFTTTFDCVASTAYTVRFARTVNVAANAAVLNLAAVIVGPGIQPQGAAVSEYESATSYTIGATTTAPTPGAGSTFYRRTTRVGSYALIRWEFSQTVAGSAGTGTYTLPLPSGITVDASRVRQLGTAGELNAFLGGGRLTATSDYVTFAIYNSATAVQLQIHNDVTGLSNWGASLGALSTTTVRFGVEARIPIAEWAGSGTVNLAQNDVEFLSHDGANTVHGPAGALIPSITASAVNTATTYTLTPQTPWVTSPTIQFQKAGAGPWIDVEYGVNAAQTDYQSGGRQNTGASARFYGISTYSSGGSVIVSFGNAGAVASGTSYGAVGSNYPATAGDRYRLVKAVPGQAVGWGAATQNSLGLAKAGQFPGTNTNDNAVAGNVGELVYAGLAIGSAVSLTTATATTITSISLTAGDWDVSGAVVYRTVATTSITEIAAIVSKTTNSVGSSLAGQIVSGESRNGINSAAYVPGSGAEVTILTMTTRVSLSATTTMFLIARPVFTVSTITGYGSISARRVR